jgi:cytochrome c peroxidase
MSMGRKVVAGVLAAIALSFVSVIAMGDGASGRDETRWQPGAIGHARFMRIFHDRDHGKQATPPVIPSYELDRNESGAIGTYQPNGPTRTSQNPFFQSLGSNDRTCFTCHQPADGWGVSAEDVRARFDASWGSDPIFRLVDGATCPRADVSSYAAKRQAYALLLDKGLLRIGLAMPSNAQFEVTAVDDPYGCNTDPVTGLTSPTSGIVSVYRRPLPSTNLGFLSAVMWDGREPDLLSQALDATLGHAQANFAPTTAQLQQIVDFESGLYSAQAYDTRAHDLDADGASGGPYALDEQLGYFYIGINDPFGFNPTGTVFNPAIFDLYGSWAAHSDVKSAKWDNRGGHVDQDEAREAVARGEALFNSTVIIITGVSGINDALNQPSFSGSCGTCHDTPSVGNHSVKAPLDIGIADAGAKAPPALDITGLPVFTLQCVAGPLAGQTFTVTDPGRALISGNCVDIGKFKGPILRGLASRAPYFHNGSAKTLMDVINFYDQRFTIGFTAQQKEDLLAFLKTL